MYYCSCLLLFVSVLTVISNVNSASAHKRGLLPTNINIDIKLGKGSTAKSAEAVPPAPGDKKTVINAPFGLASLTITTNRKNSSTANESGKPCNPETENIETNNGIKNSYYGGSRDSDTLGGKGDAFFGLPHPPPYSDYGPPPPPPHDFHHPYPHYPPPPSHHHHFHHYPPPPPPHHHHPDCHHGEDFPPFTSSTKLPLIPEKKPDGKFTSTVVPKDIIPQQTQSTTSTQRTTENVDALIDDIFGGPNSSSSTTSRNNIDVNNQEQTGEGNLDIRMPGSH